MVFVNYKVSNYPKLDKLFAFSGLKMKGIIKENRSFQFLKIRVYPFNY